MSYKLGIDIGGTKVNIGIIDENKRIVFKHAEKLPANLEYKNILSYIKNVLDKLLIVNTITYNQIESCGMGVPGTVSQDGKRVIKVPNLHWENVNCSKEFESLTHIPTKLVQDSRAAAFGEYLAGAGQGKKLVVCITLGTGIGTGIVMNGNIFDGILGSAGEIGHIPVASNGRPCGCGKKDCLENYVAGKGLAMTANELMAEKGGNLTAEDVFDMAQSGSEIALKILGDAVEMLGNALVSVVNLISPDALLFSGGMSNQKELFLEPLMKYIYEHSYNISIGEGFYMGKATLGDDAPMIGAALQSDIIGKRAPRISASIMCANMLYLQNDLYKLEEAKIDYIHFDIMDGHFVPNLMLPIELLNAIRQATNLPFDIHLMVENPEKFIPLLNIKEGDMVSVHWESTPHVQRVLSMIKEKGANAVLAINPSTPIECCRDLLDDISMILIMTVNPGFAGQKLIPQSLDKITRIRKYLDDLGYCNIAIEADGNCSYENVPKMYAAGADTFVAGSSSIFDPQLGIIAGTNRLRALLNKTNTNMKEEI
ncbi:MAG TPA: ribulose-phosphate 3-epimerase [Clostridiaceae bacterium]